MNDLEKTASPDIDVKVVDDADAERAAILASFSAKETKKLLRKVDFVLIPLLMVAYLLKNIDANISGYVKVMNAGSKTNILKELNMSTNEFGYLSTVGAVALIIFEIPSNLLMKWSTPRIHFCRIVTLWSVIEMTTAGCTTGGGLIANRFFLNVAEAGMWPGILVQLTSWYRPDEIALRMAVISMLGQWSSIIDALLCYGIAYIDGAHGVSGWRWAYIITGVIGALLGAALFLLHPDYPDQSKRQYFSVEEQHFLVARLPSNASKSSDANFSWKEIKMALMDPICWGFGFCMMLEQTGTVGFTFWLPTIIAGFGFTGTANSQLLNIPPSAMYIISAAIFAYWLDHQSRIPRPVFQFAALLMMIGFFAGLTVLHKSQKGPILALIILIQMPSALFQVNVFPWRAQTVKGSSYAATAFAMQNSIGYLASIFAAQIFQSKYAPSYRIPFIVCEIFLAVAALAVAFTWWKTYAVEAEFRRIGRVRREAAKNGNVNAEEDISPDLVPKNVTA